MPLGSWYSQLPAFGWFDREDRPGSAALGVPDWQQGIALPSRSTLGKWFNVTPPGGGLPYPMQQTDIGPAKWTGRGVDISAAAAHQMGYTPGSFPTNANFKVEPRDEPRGLGSPAGLPVQAGDLPDNAAGDAYAGAVASGPSARKTMPTSLMDMFTPTNAASGQPIGFSDAIAQNRNSLIGLGMGLLQPRSLAVGAPTSSAWGNALGGYQQGAQTDAANAYRQAQLQHQKTQDARQAAQDAFNRQMAEKQFAQSTLTPYQKMQADIARAKGTPDEQQVTDFYRKQLETEPPQTREVFDPTLGRNVVQEFDPRKKQWQTATLSGGAAPPTPAFDPFTAGSGRPVYGQGAGGYSAAATAAAPAAPAAGAQPLLPARKPLTAHEQTAIDEADKATLANQQVLGTLQDAKRLSKTAFSGAFPMQRAMIGAQFPENLPPGTSTQPAKDTLLLNNAVISQAVEQLKATFGGNPSEGERKILLDLAGSMNAPDSVRQDIYDRAMKAANAKLQLNQRRAQDIRGGTYYGPGDNRPAPSIGGAAGPSERKTIGGKGYSKIGGQWYED